MYFLEFIGCFITIFVLFASNCGGLGGGGAVVPIVMVFFNYDVKTSIALSNSTIVIAALTRMIINSKLPHPSKTDVQGNPSGVIIDYNIASLMLPMIIVGAMIGVAV